MLHDKTFDKPKILLFELHTAIAFVRCTQAVATTLLLYLTLQPLKLFIPLPACTLFLFVFVLSTFAEFSLLHSTLSPFFSLTHFRLPLRSSLCPIITLLLLGYFKCVFCVKHHRACSPARNAFTASEKASGQKITKTPALTSRNAKSGSIQLQFRFEVN